MNSSNFVLAAPFKRVLFVCEDIISRAETELPNDDVQLDQMNSASSEKEDTMTTQGASKEDDVCVVKEQIFSRSAVDVTSL